MKKSDKFCVIMAGGIGTRFWPMSRSQKPKQFLDVLGVGKTMLQQTYERFLKICPNQNIFVVTSEGFNDLVKTQLPNLPTENILLEPSRKNTAPCVAYACYKISCINPEAVTVIAPSDHLILKEDTFTKAINACMVKAQSKDCLVTLGIKPSRPDTGYGYIQFVASDTEEKDKRIHKVKTFTEKPDLDMAKFFLESGDFLWNAGIFIWRTKSIIKAFEHSEPDMAQTFSEGLSKYNTDQEEEFIKEAYSKCKNISIDYAVMEKAENVYVRSSAIGWSDLGTWGSLYTHIPLDKNKNAIIGDDIILNDVKNSIIRNETGKILAVQGIEDCIIVESDGIILVCKTQDEQKIRAIVSEIKTRFGEPYV
jgi:mannose-1-phosphate guanylyltransferase